MTASTRSRSWDHPRACGEHDGRQHVARHPAGSSPRLRGTPVSVIVTAAVGGIIPALAGNTSISSVLVSLCRDHPRACGEHRFGCCSYVPSTGSSPRLRGTLELVPEVRRCQGIIPALAGNTLPGFFSTGCLRDHPRACGEHPRAPMTMFHIAGSSPRLRGTPEPDPEPVQGSGIIPALAGNTSCRVPTGSGRWDHPRACGEHVDTGGEGDVGLGIIPALAGNTASCRA